MGVGVEKPSLVRGVASAGNRIGSVLDLELDAAELLSAAVAVAAAAAVAVAVEERAVAVASWLE